MAVKVSIGMPFRNPGPFFADALKSIFAQTYQDWELILLDDGSTDGSLELARGLDDPRVRVISDGNCRGLARRLNEITNMAAGALLARMDADDIMHPERLAKQAAAYRQAGDGNVVIGTNVFSIDKDSRIVGSRPVSGRQRSGFAARHSFIHPTVMASKRWFLDNPYSENLLFHRAEDAELWCRTSGATRFIILEEPLLFYRESGVFNLANYVASGHALTQILLKQYSTRRLHFICLYSRETFKTWLATVLSTFNWNAWLVERRYRPLKEVELEGPGKVLEQIAQIKLPLHLTCKE